MLRYFQGLLITGILLISVVSVYCQQNISFQHDGLNRNYHLYIPDSLPDHAPLVLVLHGYMQLNDWCQDYLGFDAMADTAGFVVCYPQGTTDFLGFEHWNFGLSYSTVDDIGFLSALANFLQQTYGLDPNRTFSCGFSNGGFMSYTLACEAPEIFRAIGSVAGTMGGDTWENCTTTNKTPLIQFHGIDDDVIPIDGSGLPLGWGGAPRIRTIVDFWSNKNECSSLDSIQMTSNTERFIHSAGLGGNEVWYYEIANHGHEWPGSSEPGITDVSGIDASNIIWSFFKQFGNRMITHSDLYLEERCLSMYGLELLPEITLKGSLSQYTIEILNGQEQAISIIESTDDIYVLDPLNLGEEAMFIKVQSKSLIELGFQDLIPNGNF